MALSIDSRAVFRAIADHSDAFPAVQTDMDEFARKVLIKQIKHKTTDLAVGKALRAAVGEKTFSTVLDGLSANELGAALKRMDPHSQLLKSGDDRALRLAFEELVDGRRELSAKPVKTPPVKKTTAARAAKPKIGDLLESKVHAGTPRKQTSARKTF